jgi:chitodextrinase
MAQMLLCCFRGRQAIDTTLVPIPVPRLIHKSFEKEFISISPTTRLKLADGMAQFRGNTMLSCTSRKSPRSFRYQLKTVTALSGILLFAPPLSVKASDPLVTDPNAVFTVPQVSKPLYPSPFKDPVFGTTVMRIAGDTGTPIEFSSGDAGTWGSDARQHYTDVQTWNSDGTLFALQNRNGGSPSLVILDGTTYQPKSGKCSNYSGYDDRWHPNPSHPRERINLKRASSNLNQLEWFDVVSCAQTRNWTLPFAATGDFEANPSREGRFAALNDSTRVFVVDMDPQPPLASYASGNKRIGPAYDFSNCGLSDCTVDWISISPSGKYVVIGYNGDHLRVFDVNPDTLKISPRSMPANAPECSGHDPAQGYIYDLGHQGMALNPFDNNEDVIIGQRRSWCPATVNGVAMGHVVMVRLKDGVVTTLTSPANEAYAYHISTQNLDRPGWAYVSYYPQDGKRFNDEIIAVKMDGSQTVERLTHTHTDTTDCYRCEAHPVPSRDGKRVVFASSWSLNCGSNCGTQSDVKAYVVDTGANSTDTTPPSVPTGLTATAASASRINLAWSAATDNVGVAGYRIYRNGARIATSASTSYADTGLTADTTYSYTVAAVDAAGNTSAQSSAASATTPPASSGTPLIFTPTNDARILSGSPTTNYGSSSTLTVDNSPVTHFLLKFNVAGLAAPVLSAKLRLYNTNDPSVRGGNFYRAANTDSTGAPWSEKTVTWNTAPAYNGSAAIASLGQVNAGTWREVDVTGLVTGNGIYSLRITSPSGDGANYASKEKTGFAPRLVITLK